jgi:hypothetical protein
MFEVSSGRHERGWGKSTHSWIGHQPAEASGIQAALFFFGAEQSFGPVVDHGLSGNQLPLHFPP